MREKQNKEIREKEVMVLKACTGKSSALTCVTLHHSLGVVHEHHSSLASRLGGVVSISSRSTSLMTLSGQSRRDTSRLSPTAFRAGPILL